MRCKRGGGLKVQINFGVRLINSISSFRRIGSTKHSDGNKKSSKLIFFREVLIILLYFRHLSKINLLFLASSSPNSYPQMSTE